MKDLILQFSGQEGGTQECKLDVQSLVIGRHSECGLVIPDPRLSREHIKLERYADVFTVSDLESSNGTELNGEPLGEPAALNDGDILVLGGGVELKVTIVGDESDAAAEETGANKPAVQVENVNQDKGFRIALFLAPILGLFVLIAVVIGAVFLTGGKKEISRGPGSSEPEYGSSGDPVQDGDLEPNSDSAVSVPTLVESPGPATDPSEQADPIPSNASSSPDVGNGAPNPDRKIEVLVYSFMKKIAKNDQRPFLTEPRIQEIAGRINSFRGSRALASNLRSAAADSGRISAMAKSSNIQPHFLAAAALTRLGGNVGNVFATASDMSGPLDKLTIVLSNELADDALLVIAAYNEGVAGNNLKMRDRLANLAKRNPTASSREIRTIWFLKEKGEISAAQYDFAMNFLAIGTIMQNPKELGVNSEALSLD